MEQTIDKYLPSEDNTWFYDEIHGINDRSGWLSIEAIYKTVFTGSRFGKTSKRITTELNELHDIKWLSDKSSTLLSALICELFVDKNLDALDVFHKKITDNEHEPFLKFLLLIRFVQKLNGSYQVAYHQTNSNFWGMIKASDIFDDTFMLFHMDHCLFHLDQQDPLSFKNAKCSSLYGHSNELHNEDKLIETRNFLSTLIPNVLEILKSPDFDELFKHFYSRYAKAKGFDQEKLLNYLTRSTTSSQLSQSLLIEKLRSIGFVEK